jgi:molecular chaperone DnaJ
MAQTRDLYEVLGVPRDASQEEIKRAYRRLARAYHPDVSNDPDAEHKIKELNLAYQTLSDPAKRRQYDMFGGEGLSPDMFVDLGDISDIFEAFFGSPFGRRSRRTRRRSRGSDAHAVVEMSFEEAAFGTRTEVEIEVLEGCDTCGGSGADPGTGPTRCSHCGGTGEVSDMRRSVFGTVMTSRICGTCGGSGQEILSPCQTCRGEGRVPRVRTLPVDVPAGVADGVELRIEGGGNRGHRGAPPGDLYVTLRVAPHPVFERRGQDLVAVLEVPLTQAVLGTELEVRTLDGTERVRIPPGTRAGTVIRLRGRGVPNLQRRGRGDLFFQVDLAVPESLSREERALLERLADLRGERPGRGPRPGRLRRPE